MHPYLAGTPYRRPEATFDTANDHVDVFIAFRVEVRNVEKMFEKRLLGSLQMEEVSRVVENAQGIQLVKVDFRRIGIDIRHIGND